MASLFPTGLFICSAGDIFWDESSATNIVSSLFFNWARRPPLGK
jgi:hypothetical protein